MNATITAFARAQIKETLAQVPESQHDLFRRMYSWPDLTKPINDVVDQMPDAKLDWALTQCQNGLRSHCAKQAAALATVP